MVMNVWLLAFMSVVLFMVAAVAAMGAVSPFQKWAAEVKASWKAVTALVRLA